MEVAENLLEEGKALLSDAVEGERDDFPGGWQNDSHVHGTPIAMRRRTSQARLENVRLFQIQHEITSLSFVENIRVFHSTSRHKKDSDSKVRDFLNLSKTLLCLPGGVHSNGYSVLGSSKRFWMRSGSFPTAVTTMLSLWTSIPIQVIESCMTGPSCIVALVEFALD
jgi:hypothetical protein